MLPKDARNRQHAKVEAQPDLHPHLKEKPRVIPYTDASFRDAAVEWLVSTDQVSENVVEFRIIVNFDRSQSKRFNIPHFKT
jgi:hypothetical protein